MLICTFDGFVGFGSRRSQVEGREEGSSTNWYKTERELCAKYHRFYGRVNKDAAFYEKCANYLNKVEERGRKPTGMVLWVATIFLVILEAFIFALVLSPFIATNISANQAEFSAIIVSLLIGTILVPATHLMGAEIHKNGLVAGEAKGAYRSGDTLQRLERFWSGYLQSSNASLISFGAPQLTVDLR
ncbi:MAG: hypothetical protein VCA57_07025 [Pseudomonas sp.]|uniref:hypothetical protein n=1 Tax=Pseudomonas sp. TaxID=306 RepID=UPI003982CA36